MKVWMAWLVVVGSLVSGVIEADPSDGNTLLKACRLAERHEDGEKLPESQVLLAGYCLGLISGVGHTLDIFRKSLRPEARICFPSTAISNRQAAQIVVKYLDDIPEYLNQDPAWLTFLAYRAAYPCK